MGGPKTKQSQQQASTTTSSNTFGQVSPLDDPRYAAAVGDLGKFQFQNDPRIGYTYGRQRQQAHESFADPRGGFTTPQLERQMLNAGDADSAQQEAQAYREENYGKQGLEFGKLEDIAQLSAPRTVQTGGTSNSSGTSTGTSQTSPGALDSIMKGGSLALMAF